MARWFTSDPHFGHANIIDYCDRPHRARQHPHSPDPDAMGEAIIDRYNEMVPATDELWILGDIAMGRYTEGDPESPLAVGVRMLADVNATVVLVAGNHDRYHPAVKAKKVSHQVWAERYADWAQADRLYPTGTQILLPGVSTPVLVNHFPYSGESRHGQPDRYEEWRPIDGGGWLLCGHVHDMWQQRNRQINVGLDAWAGSPVHEDVLAARMLEGPANRDSARWAKVSVV